MPWTDKYRYEAGSELMVAWSLNCMKMECTDGSRSDGGDNKLEYISGNHSSNYYMVARGQRPITAEIDDGRSFKSPYLYLALGA